MRKLLHTVLSLLCLLTASCFESREEIWVHRDGSGRAEIRYTIPNAALLVAGGRDGIESSIRRFFDSEPSIRLDKLAIDTSTDGTTIRIAASTDSMLDLIELTKSESAQSLPTAASRMIGEFDIRLDGLEIDFHRTCDLRDAIPLSSFAISEEDKKNRRLICTFHLPTRAREHNATSVSDDGKTLVWDRSLEEALAVPLTTSVRLPLPIPWGKITVGLIAGVLLIVLLVRRWKRLRKHPRAPHSPA